MTLNIMILAYEDSITTLSINSTNCKNISESVTIYPKVFVLGMPFQHGLIFLGKAGAYPSEAPFRSSTQGQTIFKILGLHSNGRLQP